MSGVTPKFILASASPRRAEILQTLGLPFETVVADVNEDVIDGETPSDYVVRVAKDKALTASHGLTEGIVIGADTAVVIDGRPLGKPTGSEDARAMLRTLSGRWHAVMTGVAIYDVAQSQTLLEHDKTLVRFRELTDAEIDQYVATGEPMDKAGAYAIQGRGMLLVEEIAGNYQNVVGLPATLLQRMLARLGVAI